MMGTPKTLAELQAQIGLMIRDFMAQKITVALCHEDNDGLDTQRAVIRLADALGCPVADDDPEPDPIHGGYRARDGRKTLND